MKQLLVLAVLAACGDGKSAPADGSIDGPVDAGVDAPIDAPVSLDAPMAPTFTSFTIDLIQNNTSNTTNAVPFATFMGLTDPDLNNAAAYNVLFP